VKWKNCPIRKSRNYGRASRNSDVPAISWASTAGECLKNSACKRLLGEMERP
jgi:hypothetical protein